MVPILYIKQDSAIQLSWEDFENERMRLSIPAFFGIKSNAEVTSAFKFQLFTHAQLLKKQCNISLRNATQDIENAKIRSLDGYNEQDPGKTNLGNAGGRNI